MGKPIRLKDYGLTKDVWVDWEEGQLALRGVVNDGTSRHIRAVLSPRAYSVLWFKLTRWLYPEEAPRMTSAAGTAPLTAPSDPQMTSFIEVGQTEDGKVELIGTTLKGDWRILITVGEARRLWAKLDIILFPFGWQGRESYVNPDRVTSR